MMAIEEVTTTNETVDVPEDDERIVSILVARLEFLGVSQASKDGYFAGRKHNRDTERMDNEEFERLFLADKLLTTHPTAAEFSRYIRRVRPKCYTGIDAEDWARYFIMGWYSRVFHLDTCN